MLREDCNVLDSIAQEVAVIYVTDARTGGLVGDAVLAMTVIVRVPVADLPELSVAVTVTAVFPTGKDDPLG